MKYLFLVLSLILLGVLCQSQQQEEQMSGAPLQINFYEEDPTFQRSVFQLLEQQLETNDKIEIVSATKQVVAGLMYGIICQVGQDQYYVKIVTQPWNDSIDIIYLSKI